MRATLLDSPVLEATVHKRQKKKRKQKHDFQSQTP